VPTGVNQLYEDEALASNAGFNAAECPPLGCATQGCPPDSMVACDTGICVPRPGCSQRGEQDCALDSQCETYEARLCGGTEDFAYFTCGKPKGSCDEALTCVVSPAGQQVEFPDGCVPDGYTQACPSACE
jgi:hypothetical protein